MIIKKKTRIGYLYINTEDIALCKSVWDTLYVL